MNIRFLRPRTGARLLAPLVMSVCAALPCVPAAAQTSTNVSSSQIGSGTSNGGSSATTMWGASTGGSSQSSSSLESATTHETLGQSAGLVEAAKKGYLIGQGNSITLQSIGAQSIVSTTIYGENNVANVSATQTSTNSGAVSANGSISLNGNASNSQTNVGSGSKSTAGTAGAAASDTTGTNRSPPAGGPGKDTAGVSLP